MIDLGTISLKDKDTQKFLASACIGIVLIIAFLAFLLIPKASKLLYLIRENSKLDTQLSAAAEDAAKIDGLNSNKAGLAAEISALQERFLEETQIPLFLEELSKLAEETSVRLNSLKIPKEVAEAGEKEKTPLEKKYKKVPIFIEAECGFHDLGRFINKLESAKRFISVSDIEIKAQKESPGLHRVDLEIETIARQRIE